MISRFNRLTNSLKTSLSKITGNGRQYTEQHQDVTSTVSMLQSTHAQSSTKAKKKHDLLMLLSLGLAVIIGCCFMKYQATKANNVEKEAEAKLPLNLAVASSALDIDKMWRNHLEDKIMDAKNQSNDKLKLIESSINDQSVAYTNQLKDELEKLKAQMQYLAEEQASAKRELDNARIKFAEEERPDKNHQLQVDDSRITVNHLDRGEQFDRPKSARSYIPETAYVKGILLGGIVVSTSNASMAEPVPVIIRVTGRGNLPNNFAIDLAQCHILGSAYGDLSSERAVIRAEILKCKDLVNELIYTTKIAGLIYGDDGMNGIKGKVVQTSSKHLKNAMIGGVISGFAGAAVKCNQVLTPLEQKL
jgi:hypothetical protein